MSQASDTATIKLIKQSLINESEGFPCKCIYRNEASLIKASESQILFDGLTPDTMTPTSVKHKFVNHCKEMEGIEIINAKDWLLDIQIFEWDEYINEKAGEQKYKMRNCIDYKIWKWIDLEMIDRGSFCFILKTNKTRSEIHSMSYM